MAVRMQFDCCRMPGVPAVSPVYCLGTWEKRLTNVTFVHCSDSRSGCTIVIHRDANMLRAIIAVLVLSSVPACLQAQQTSARPDSVADTSTYQSGEENTTAHVAVPEVQPLSNSPAKPVSGVERKLDSTVSSEADAHSAGSANLVADVSAPSFNEGSFKSAMYALPLAPSPIAPAPRPISPTQRSLKLGEHRFWDRENVIGFAVHGAVRVADATQTCMLLGKPGRHESTLPMQSCGAIAAYSVASIPAQIGTSYLLHRRGHHTMERWLPYLWAAPSAVGFGVSLKAW
jgi:hypothetical protein